MATLPSISIVVPNYNGGKTIEATLRSLLDQSYPNLEIIVIDGGSKDDSVEIIKKFESRIAYWVSEKDKGQSDAINKGMARCTGEIVNWLCSDDLHVAGTLDFVGRTFAEHPEIDVLAGRVKHCYPDIGVERIEGPDERTLAAMPEGNPVRQPACFWRQRTVRRPFTVRQDLFFQMDTELWNHLHSVGARWLTTDRLLAVAIEAGDNKTRQADYRTYIEYDQIFRQYARPGQRASLPRWFRYTVGPMYRAGNASHSMLMKKTLDMGIRWVSSIQKRWRILTKR